MKKEQYDSRNMPYHVDESDMAATMGKLVIIGVSALSLVIGLIIGMAIIGISKDKGPVYHMSEDKKYVYNHDTGEIYRVIKDPFTTIQDLFGEKQ